MGDAREIRKQMLDLRPVQVVDPSRIRVLGASRAEMMMLDAELQELRFAAAGDTQ